jgi:hypothetical protein
VSHKDAGRGYLRLLRAPAADAPPLSDMRATTATAQAQAQKGSDWIETGVGWSVAVLRTIPRFKRSWVPNDLPKVQTAWSQYLPEPSFMSIHAGGSSNGHVLGCCSIDGCARNMSDRVPLARPGFTWP